MNLREAYEDSLRHHGHARDPAQEAVLAELERLQRELYLAASSQRGWWQRLGLRAAPPPVKGLYIYGGVGRGKTFLMDLFYETLQVDGKRRIHFHRMLHEVHSRLAQLGDIEDPLEQVAADFASNTTVLCFDEFFVSDIGDAMILGRLLQALFERGVTLVTTSNTAPDDLYQDGLQRQQFLPAIEALKAHTRIVEMADGIDYRLQRLQQSGTYFCPADEAADAALAQYFDDAASSDIRRDHQLTVNARDIAVRACAKGIAWFDFDAICDGPRSQNDYIEIARWYPTVIVSAVPVLDSEREDPARRFIALVDEFYDRRVKLILSAAARIDDLYTGTRLGFEFERTTSRLFEMQSETYLAAPHLA